MNILRKSFSWVVFGTMPLLFISCSEAINQKNPLKADCPADYKLTDVAHIEEYYGKLVSKKSQYLAFKELSSSGYKLVSLVNNDKQYILSVSLSVIPDGTISTIVDPKIGSEIFKQVGKVESLDSLDLGEAFHTNCVFVGIKTLNKTLVSSLYNPPILIHQYKQYKNSGLKLYSTLVSLADQTIPNHTKKIISAYTDGMPTINIGEQVFYPDTYVNATKGESKLFRKKLMRNPFFEIENFVNR
jgi:hypothetical protein